MGGGYGWRVSVMNRMNVSLNVVSILEKSALVRV